MFLIKLINAFAIWDKWKSPWRYIQFQIKHRHLVKQLHAYNERIERYVNSLDDTTYLETIQIKRIVSHCITRMNLINQFSSLALHPEHYDKLCFHVHYLDELDEKWLDSLASIESFGTSLIYILKEYTRSYSTK